MTAGGEEQPPEATVMSCLCCYQGPWPAATGVCVVSVTHVAPRGQVDMSAHALCSPTPAQRAVPAGVSEGELVLAYCRELADSAPPRPRSLALSWPTQHLLHHACPFGLLFLGALWEVNLVVLTGQLEEKLQVVRIRCRDLRIAILEPVSSHP